MFNYAGKGTAIIYLKFEICKFEIYTLQVAYNELDWALSYLKFK